MKNVSNIVFNSFKNDSRVEKISKSLVNNGYRVEVIAHLDKGMSESEKKDGYEIRRFVYFDRKITTSKLSKLFIYLKWIVKVIQHAKNSNIIHCNDLNTLPIGVIIKIFLNKNVKVVYDAHEHESERCHLSKTMNKISRIIEKLLIKHADSVITVSESIAEDYQKIYSINKPKLILNTPPYKKIEKRNIFREEFDISSKQIIFLFQGLISEGRGIEDILEVFKSLYKNDNKAVIVFMGYGSLVGLVKRFSKTCDNIFYQPAVEPKVLLDYTSSADFGIHMAQGHCLSYLYALPNKTFEYIMAELPIIVTDLPELGNLVKKNKIGILIKENTRESLKKSIIYALNLNVLARDELLRNIKKTKKIYCWEEQEKILISIYNNLKEK